jgi:hypothetical protein
MFEHLDKNRTIKYKWIDEGKLVEQKGSWEFLAKPINFPERLTSNHCYKSIVSPDLKYFLDWSNTVMLYVIKDFETEEIVATIPKSMIHHNDDHFHADSHYKKFHNFKWIGSTKILYCNEEGIERVWDIFKVREIGHNSIPYYER